MFTDDFIFFTVKVLILYPGLIKIFPITDYSLEKIISRVDEAIDQFYVQLFYNLFLRYST